MTTTTELNRVDTLLQTLDRLISFQPAGHILSIYMPAGRTHEEANAARIRFKTQLKNGRAEVLRHGFSESDANRFVHPLEERFGDEDFWEHQEGGLAAFSDGTDAQFFRVGAEMPSKVVFGPRHSLKPLLAVGANADAYFLILITLNNVKLFRGSRLGFREFECEGLPSSYENWCEQEKFDADSSMSIAAQSNLKPTDHHLRKFFERIDDRVSRRVGHRNDPVILACVDHYFPIYREISSVRHLAPQYLPGNFEHADLADLHARASKALRHEFIESRKRALLAFKNGRSDPRAETDLANILKAAASGQIRTLFVPEDADFYGTYLIAEHQIDTSEGPNGAQAVDLYEEAARKTLYHGGETFFLKEAQLPTSHKSLAILRWAPDDLTSETSESAV